MFADEKKYSPLAQSPLPSASLGWNPLHKKEKELSDERCAKSKPPHLNLPCKIDSPSSEGADNKSNQTSPLTPTNKEAFDLLRPSSELTHNLTLEIAQMHLRFADLLCSTSLPEASLLHDQFIRASASIEVGRLCRLKSADHEDIHLVNSLFDHSHRTLIHTTKMQIDDIENKFIQPIDLSTKKKHSRKQLHPMPILQYHKYEPKSQVKEEKASPSRPVCKLSSSHSPSSPPKSPARPMNIDASRILNNWYIEHHDHPYPSHEVSQRLAKAGNITTGQVKKWFANRRRRDGNIKPLSAVTAKRRQTQMDANIDLPTQ